MSNVALVDVKHIDGEPWDVARVAGEQTTAALSLASEALDALAWAARGSWLSQEEYRKGAMPTLVDFEAAPLYRKLQAADEALTEARRAVAAATAAASHDPRSH